MAKMTTEEILGVFEEMSVYGVSEKHLFEISVRLRGW